MKPAEKPMLEAVADFLRENYPDANVRSITRQRVSLRGAHIVTSRERLELTPKSERGATA